MLEQKPQHKMTRLIKTIGSIKEGEVINKWIYNRMILRNKNILVATVGPTGSGKSYMNLSVVQNWYQNYFGEDYPVEKNVCFSIDEVMFRLASKELRRGDILILEESGVSFGALDFQNKVSKMMNYVMQSFRSMNIGLIMNMPVFDMLNKSARLLVHASFETRSINYEKKTCMYKPKFHQVNNSTGRIYRKRLIINYNGKAIKISNMVCSKPPQHILDVYEKKKADFLQNLIGGFADEFVKARMKEEAKTERVNLSTPQQEVFDMLQKGLKVPEIAKERDVSIQAIYKIIKSLKEKGFNPKYEQNPLENQPIKRLNPSPEPVNLNYVYDNGKQLKGGQG